MFNPNNIVANNGMNEIDRMFSQTQVKSLQTDANTRPGMDNKYVKLDTQDNSHSSRLQLENYRQQEYTQNPEYLFKKDQVYDLQGIEDGYGIPKQRIDIDSELRQSNMVPKPIDKLNTKVTYIRRAGFLPKNEASIQHNKFLVSTTLSQNPQVNYNPSFAIYGQTTRDFARLPSDFYRQYQ